MRSSRALLLAFLGALLWCAPAWATIQYNSDNASTGFDATTANTLPSGWTAISGTWAVQTSGTYALVSSHTHSFGISQSAAAEAYYSGISAIGDMEVASTQVISAFSGSQISVIQTGVRYNSAGTSGYLAAVIYSGGNISLQLYKEVSGTFTQLGSTTNFAVYPGVPFTLNTRLSVVGTTVSATAWVGNVASEPTSPTIQQTDSSVTGNGYALVRNGTGYTSHYTGVTDFTINDNPYGATASILAYTPYNIAPGATVSGVYTGTAPLAINYALDGASSFTAATGFSASGGNFSFTMPSASVGYHQMTIDSGLLTTITSATPAFLVGSSSGKTCTLSLLGAGPC